MGGLVTGVSFRAHHRALGLGTALEQPTGAQRRNQPGPEACDAINGEDYARACQLSECHVQITTMALAIARTQSTLARVLRKLKLTPNTAPPLIRLMYCRSAQCGPRATGAQVE